jgi:hypothetical protein
VPVPEERCARPECREHEDRCRKDDEPHRAKLANALRRLPPRAAPLDAPSWITASDARALPREETTRRDTRLTLVAKRSRPRDTCPRTMVLEGGG